MKSIAEKLIEVINTEKNKNIKNKNFKELDELLLNIDKFGYINKPDYSFPLVDTIGKTTYSILNKNS